MTPDVVVDIGNSRVKWGKCAPTVAAGGWVAQPHGDMAAWDAQAEKWEITPGSHWAISGVNPTQVELFTSWVLSIGGAAVVFRKPSELPIKLSVDQPDGVGIDRVFGALAARSMVPPGTPAITVDVGTAVTVNLIDADGVFQGGAIFPGPALMARSLHEHTAKLPPVQIVTPESSLPAKNTIDAIQWGVFAAVGGGVVELTNLLASRCASKPFLFVTGGGADVIRYDLPWVERINHIPSLNLEGVRIAAEALP